MGIEFYENCVGPDLKSSFEYLKEKNQLKGPQKGRRRFWL